ncbi:MAG: serine hydrolase domain-containing protein, partial [Kordiimonas sp.]
MTKHSILKPLVAALILTFLPPTAMASDEPASTQIDHILEEAYPTGGAGAALLIYKDGEILYRKAIGYADIEAKIPNTLDLKYRLASVTKQFTAIAALRLVQEGKLDLDADIRTYLPDFPNKGHIVTLRSALAHTAGLYNYTNHDDYEAVQTQDFTIEDIFQWFANEPLEFEPDTNWDYSNSGYALTSRVMEVVTGTSARTLVREILFKPAGMTNSRFLMVNDQLADIPVDYNATHGPLKKVKDTGRAGFGDGEIISTVDDMLKWYLALKNDTLLQSQYKEIAFADNTLRNGQKTRYGLGYMLGHFDGEKSLEHGGSRSGSHAYSIMIPSQDFFLIMFSNLRDNTIGITAANIAKHALGIAGKRPPAFNAARTMMQAWTGHYKHGENDIRTITYKDGYLYSQRGDHGGKYKLLPMA